MDSRVTTPQAYPADDAQPAGLCSDPDSRNSSDRQGARDGIFGSGSALRLRRARAAHRRGDDARAPRQAPPGLRGQGQRGARGHRVGRQADRGRAQEPQLAARPTSRARSATTAAVTTTTRCSGSGCRPTAAASPTARSREAIDSAFGSFDDFKAKFKDGGVDQFGSGWSWLVHDGSGLARRLDRQPGQPDLPTARRRCSASTSGSTPTTSSTRTSARTTSTPAGTSSTGPRSPSCCDAAG